MEISKEEGQLQIHLSTKQLQYAVPDSPYSIGANVTPHDLNTLVNSLLRESSPHSHADVEFDFIVIGETLKIGLGDFLRDKSISFEDVIEIEYVERFPAPEPQDCLLHDDWVSAVDTCNNWIISGCYDNTINIWTTKGAHVLTIPGHVNPIKAISWVSVNESSAIFISCSQDQTAMLWEWNIKQNSVECAYVCKGHQRAIDCVGVSLDKKQFATGSWDSMLKIWSTSLTDSTDKAATSNEESGKSKSPLMTLQGHRECISSVQYIDNSMILTSSWDHTMKIWDLSLEGIKREIIGNKSFFDTSYSHLSGLIICASADKNIRLYDTRTKQGSVIKFTFYGHDQWVQSVEWSTFDEHLFVSGSYDKQVKLWDKRSPKAALYDLIGHGDKVLDVNWTNPKYIVSGGADNTIRVFKSRNMHENK